MSLAMSIISSKIFKGIPNILWCLSFYYSLVFLFSETGELELLPWMAVSIYSTNYNHTIDGVVIGCWGIAHLSIGPQLPNLLHKLLLFPVFSCWRHYHLIDLELLNFENWFHIHPLFSSLRSPLGVGYTVWMQFYAIFNWL